LTICIDEINSSTTEELLQAFERTWMNENLSTNLYKPENCAWLIKDVLQDRLSGEIEKADTVSRLEYLLSVAKRLYREDLCREVEDRIRDVKS